MTSLPAPLARSRNVEELNVEAFISSLNVTVTSLATGTPVALGAGERFTIVGAVVSAWVPYSTLTDSTAGVDRVSEVVGVARYWM